MRRHAKASSAGSTQRQANGRYRLVRGAFATRAAFGDSAGSGAPAGRPVLACLFIAALTLILTMFVGSASASIQTRPPLGFSPIDGSGSGVTLHTLKGLGLDETSGNVFVNDGSGGEVVDILGAEGGAPAGLVAPFTITGLSGFGIEPSGAAVDNSATSPSKGTLYVTDVFGHKLRKFTRNPSTEKYEAVSELKTTEGAPLGEVLGTEVDTKGNVYVADWSSGSVIKFSPTGTQLARIGTEPALGRPSDVAIDSAGDLFVQAYSGGRVVKYPVNGSGEIEPAVFSTVVDSEATGLAVDPVTNTLFVAMGNRVTEFNATTLASGSEFGSFASTTRIAVNSAADRVYVADYNTATVAAFGPLQSFGDATGTATAASNVSYHSADLSATVDDNNALPTDWRLEVSVNNFATARTVASGRTAGNQAAVAVAGTATGLSLDTDYKFRVVTNKGTNAATDISSSPLPFKTLDAPDATATPLVEEETTEESVKVSAMITDNSAAPTNWRIEFSADGGSAWSPVSSGSTGGGESAVAVSGTESPLQPNTEYQFRLVTNKGEGSSDLVASTLSFKTPAPPPVITDVGAVKVSDTSAHLVASVDPRNSTTSYVFEYGTTPALGSSTAPLDIGGGLTPITVSQAIGGLSPDTTYYFQIVATNPTGPTTSSVSTLHTRTTPLPLPAQRGWEMVTPPDKNYGDADKVATYSPDVVGASPDGNSVGFCTTALFGDPPGQMTQFCAPYMSRRTAGGWKTDHPFPKYCHIDPVTGIGGGRLSVSVSRDFSHFVDRVSESAGCPGQPIDPDAPLDEENREGVAQNLYVQNPATDPFEYHLLNTVAPPNDPPNNQAASIRFVGGSNDFSHVVYLSGANQTDPPDSPAEGNFQKIYQWEEQGENGCAQADGCLSLVSKDPDGVPFSSGSGVPTFCCLGGTPYVNPSAVSADGNRVFFTNPLPGASNSIEIAGYCNFNPCQLFVRENATTTIEISASECTLGSACGSPEEENDYFLYATPSGTDAYFTTCGRLTDTSPPGTCNLYRWRQGTPSGHHLVDLTEDHEPSDGVGPDFRGLVGASDDGDTVYFVASGQIVAGGPTGEGEKIYRWRWNGGSPTVDYLGPYQRLESSAAADVNTYGTRRMVTPDGKYLMLYTDLRLDPVADQDSDSDVYRWDETDGWECASCQEPGVPSGGGVDLEEAYLKYTETLDPSLSNLAPRVFMSDDGQRIFFGTPDALVPEDVNGEVGCPRDPLEFYGSQKANLYTCEDVYEWDNGSVGLLSSGTGAQLSRIIAASNSGDDVFFYTGQRLVGWDTDNNIDIYDARVGGGFPEPPAQPAACEGESCRGAGTAAAAATGAGTAVFQGPGDPAPKHASSKHRKKHKKQRKHKKQGTGSRAANHDRRAGR